MEIKVLKPVEVEEKMKKWGQALVFRTVDPEEIDQWREDIKHADPDGRQTICAVLRDIYANTENPENKERILLAYTYAKRMNTKLRSYKWDYDEGWW